MLVWNAVLTKLMGEHPDQSFDDVNSKGLPFRYTNRTISAYGQPYVLILTMRMLWPRVGGKKGGSFVGGLVGSLVGPFVGFFVGGLVGSFVGPFLGGLIGSLVGHFVRSFGVAFALLLFMHWHWRVCHCAHRRPLLWCGLIFPPGFGRWRIIPSESKKKGLVPRTQEKRSQKNVTKNNSCHPQNRRFPLSTMVANIHLGSVIRDFNIASSRL